MKTNFEGPKEKYCNFLYKNKSLCIRNPEEEPYHLRSGGRSRMYIDHAKIGCDSASFSAFVQAIGELLPKNKPFTLCNVDSKISAQMVGALAYSLIVPQIIYKSDEMVRLEKGPMQQLAVPSGKVQSVFILDDVGTTGATVINVAKLIRNKLGERVPITLLVGLVRDPNIFTEKLKKYSITYRHIITLDELLTIHWGSFTDNQKKAILMERTLE